MLMVNLTELLQEALNGDRNAQERLIPIVYSELRKMAGGYLQKERPSHTLQPTALVNEVFIKLFNEKAISIENRSHFFGIAATQMRRILVDHARRRLADKRDAQRHGPPVENEFNRSRLSPEYVIAVDIAMSKLKKEYPRIASVVELKYYLGMNEAEAAETLGISVSTLKRDWKFAKVWLLRELGDDYSAVTGADRD